MSSDDLLLRVRAAVADQFVPVVAALVVLVAVGGWMVYGAYVAPGTTTERELASSWTAEAGFEHAATVTEPNPLYDTGTTLANRSTYYPAVSPVLNGSFDYGYRSTGEGSLDGTLQVSLVTRSVSTVERNGERVTVENWRRERPLGEQSFEGLSPDESASVDFTTNLRRAANSSERITDALGSRTGDVQTTVVVRTQVEGTVNGNEVGNATAFRLPMTFEGGTVRLQGPGAIEQPHETYRQRTVPVEVGPLRKYGSLALFFLATAALAGLVVGKRTGRLTPDETDRTVLSYRRARSEFDEWITRGRVPDDALPTPRVEVDSLRGLVDVAIDTDGRVIEDRERGEYVVVRENVHYAYEAPGDEVSVTTVGPMANGEAETDGRDGSNGERSNPESSG